MRISSRSHGKIISIPRRVVSTSAIAMSYLGRRWLITKSEVERGVQLAVEQDLDAVTAARCPPLFNASRPVRSPNAGFLSYGTYSYRMWLARGTGSYLFGGGALPTLTGQAARGFRPKELNFSLRTNSQQ